MALLGAIVGSSEPESSSVLFVVGFTVGAGEIVGSGDSVGMIDSEPLLLRKCSST